MNRKKHWEEIYTTKDLQDVSWYQMMPVTSLNLITSSNLPKDAAIIDIGGGDSFLVDHLLDLGYKDITVLDISQQAIDKAKKRLGERQTEVTWIVTDITDFTSQKRYDLWHDRAAFHFLTAQNDINTYASTLSQSIQENGTAIIGTFSKSGPKKCSSIKIKQYDQGGFETTFGENFSTKDFINVDHLTPTKKEQNFNFITLEKR
ncbi:nodulation S family protein [Crocinitomicaceae bacterium]|nr:nodulation S family protein [Crocinitomicaceae bacterium]